METLKDAARDEAAQISEVAMAVVAYCGGMEVRNTRGRWRTWRRSWAGLELRLVLIAVVNCTARPCQLEEAKREGEGRLERAMAEFEEVWY